jgi:hypothetical protein
LPPTLAGDTAGILHCILDLGLAGTMSFFVIAVVSGMDYHFGAPFAGEEIGEFL